MATVDDELEAIERSAAGDSSVSHGISFPTPMNSPAISAPKAVEPAPGSGANLLSSISKGRGSSYVPRGRGRGRRGPRKGSLCMPPSGAAVPLSQPQPNPNYDDDDDDDADGDLLVGFPTSRGERTYDEDEANTTTTTTVMRPGGDTSTAVMRPGSGSSQVMRPGVSSTPVIMPGGNDEDDGPVVMKPGSSTVSNIMRPGDGSAPVGENTESDPTNMNETNTSMEYERSKSDRSVTKDHPVAPVNLPHDNKIEVPRSKSVLKSGDSYVAEMLRKRFEQEQQAKKVGDVDDLSDDEGINDFDDAIHLGQMPKNMGTGTPAAHRPLVGGFAAAAYEAARAYHFQQQGSQMRKAQSARSNKPPPSI